MRLSAVLLTAVLLMCGNASAAPSTSASQDLSARVTRLEQTLDNQILVEMLSRIEVLQREVQQLRGQLEEQSHTMEGLQRRQRELYLDADRRLSRIERESAPPSPAEGGADQGSAVQGEGNSEEVASAEERAAYQKAFALLRDLRYDQAIKAFQDFLKSYPSGSNAPTAQYWLGEAYYVQRNYKQAIVNYQRLIDGYPASPKIAEAMLKIGSSHLELGDKKSAQKVLENLSTRFPKSTEAGQARNLLAQIKRAK